jgi:geranylgeranyl diphosphate synthase type I
MDSAADISTIEARIDYLVRNYITSGAVHTASAPGADVLDSITEQARVSNQGGKRLRALLTLAAFDAAGRSGASSVREEASRRGVLDLACAVEVFQTGALVHDDIIDDSDLRRGRPSAHVALSKALPFNHSASGEDAPDAKLGKGLGIMLGDMLATASISIADHACQSRFEDGTLENGRDNSQAPDSGRSSSPAPTAHTDSGTQHAGHEILQAFLSMHREVEIGQILDLGVEHVPLNDPARLIEASLSVFRWKTASYTTIAPIELGLLAAGIEATAAREFALDIGIKLGVAFQLADDLLDVVGDSVRTGKPVGGDIREGKRTVLLADALSGAGAQDREFLISEYDRRHRTEKEVARTIQLFHSTGAILHSQRRISDLWLESSQALAGACAELGMDANAHNHLRDACAQFIPEELRAV